MKSVIIESKTVKQRELEGLSLFGVRALKRTTKVIKLEGGRIQETTSISYIAYWVESGYQSKFTTYADLKRYMLGGDNQWR